MSQAFTQLFEYAELKKRQARQQEEAREAREAAIEIKRKVILTDWLRQTMTNLGIPAEVAGTSVDVEGFRFTIGQVYDVNSPYPLRGSIHNAMLVASVDELEAMDYKDGRFQLTIENINVGDEYRARRPDQNSPYIQHGETFRVTKTLSADFPVLIASCLKKLGTAAENAAQKKAAIDAAWEAKEAERKTRLAEEQAENERLDREWNERQECEATERAQLREAREAKELALRTEVAAKFGVSVTAYDYLIESLVDEIVRRRNASIETEY